MILHIKNMVCDRCILVVRQQLEQLALQVGDVSLGIAEIRSQPDNQQLSAIRLALTSVGFEWIDAGKDQLIERIKNILIQEIHHASASGPVVNFTALLAGRLHREYSYLSRLFSESEGLTIEKFIIQQKIEKVKELIQYDELNFNQIALQLGYSSASHLSNQFKSVTGESPRRFKLLKANGRKPLDKV